MSGDNLCVFLYDKHDIRLEQSSIPVIEKNEVLIKVSHVAICGSDMNYLKSGSSCGTNMKFPMRLGHEASGTVTQCGEEVTNLKIGDRVTIENGGSTCWKCEYCKTGHYNLCPIGKVREGYLCRYAKCNAAFCYKLPENISLEEGSLFEPFSVGVYACFKGEVTPGKKVLVCGAGAIGLLTMMSVKAFGATSIIVTDINEDYLNMARSLGADHTLNVSSLQPVEIRNKTIELLGEEPDITLECTGVESCVQAGMLTTKSGGKYVQVGHNSNAYLNVPIMSAAAREVSILAVYRYPNCFPVALDLAKTGKVNLKAVITHTFSLEETDKAYETKLNGNGNAIKVLIKCNE